jgi:hypothetical protein
MLVYGFACAAAYLVPSALGSNITRLQFVAIPIAVLVASLRSWRPLPVCVVAVGLAVSWNVKPLARSVSQGLENPAARLAYWRPAIRFFQTHLTPSYRVEAVDTVGHWPAEYLPATGIPLARGWFRQDDFPANAVLYGRLTPARYVAWLHGLGVRYVLLSSAEPDYSAQGEARLLRSGRSGLPVVFKTAALTVFGVPDPTGIVSDDRAARLIAISQARLVLRVVDPGRFRLAVRYSPYWRTSGGCIVARRDGMSELLAPRRGTVVISFHVDAAQALAALVDGAPRTCASAGHRHRSGLPSTAFVSADPVARTR